MSRPLEVCLSAINVSNDQPLRQLQDKLLQHGTQEQIAEIEKRLKDGYSEQFKTVLIGSEFAAQYLCEHPDWWLTAMRDHFRRKWSDDEYRTWFAVDPSAPEQQSLTEKQWDEFLRCQRNRAMARIIWRDFNRLASTMETTAELTFMAEAALQATLNYHFPRLCQQLGTPTDGEGRVQPMLILGMGKLGAWELNLSSDIDLIFAYPRAGETEGARRPVSNQEFFTKLGQRLIRSLDQVTAYGFVFRVDMRLRPYGQSGALVCNMNALEDYYQTQGREWERFAMIKARVVASNATAREEHQLMDMLRSFTYRRYVDYSAIEALRNLKQLINREINKRRIGDNVKLGRGGIREVEFIAQAFQIIRGGKDIQLQDRRVLRILPLLEELDCLPSGRAEQLCSAYRFLRDAEHAIQGYQDMQTQALPEDDSGQARIATVMGYDDWHAFYRDLQQHRDLVHTTFRDVIATADEAQNDEEKQELIEWQGCWNSLNASQGTVETDIAFDDPEKARLILTGDLLQAPAIASMATLSRERFDAFMPRLLQCLAHCEAPTQTLQRLVPLLTSIARRSAYLLLLSENPGALNQLIVLTQASPWISEQLAKHPALLDELLSPSSLYSVPDKATLAQELRQEVLRLDERDLEAQMEALRYFRSAHALRVAACEVTARLPLMKVSDYLTELAEVILDYVLQLAWVQMTEQHGYPDGQPTEQPAFLIVGYGKLGGIELAHGSDLDLVFIQDSDPMGSTDHPDKNVRKLENLTFYVRLGQKIIHILNTQTPSGQLYEVDMRLRPSGNSGLLVSNFNAFSKYQEESAWTWEHQALVRARPICGSPELAKRFNELRHAILARPRDPQKLATDVIEMRNKMRDQLGTNKKQKQDGQFHLKQDAGGIVDIEFMVQYAVLAWSSTHPTLTEYTDNIRILERLAQSGQMPTQEVDQLIEAYKAYRSLGHRLALQQLPGVVSAETVELERQLVTQIWQRIFNG